uniref:Uncharacterized protein n=1 Tax=Rhizophora mucronata TaxID=61149 RepID=A0A2P2NB39_RHIMU
MKVMDYLKACRVNMELSQLLSITGVL